MKVAQSCLTLCNSMDCSLWNSPGQNTGMGSLSFLQEIFLTQGWTQISCIEGAFFTSWARREAHFFLKRYSSYPSSNFCCYAILPLWEYLFFLHSNVDMNSCFFSYNKYCFIPIFSFCLTFPVSITIGFLSHTMCFIRLPWIV